MTIPARKFRILGFTVWFGLREKDIKYEALVCPLSIAKTVADESKIDRSGGYEIFEGFWKGTFQQYSFSHPIGYEEKKDMHLVGLKYPDDIKNGRLPQPEPELFYRESNMKWVMQINEEFHMKLIESHYREAENSPFPPEFGKDYLAKEFGSYDSAISWWKKKKMMEGLDKVSQ